MDLQPQAVHPNQELVKCVVVGDTAVGKTRLICARTLNKRLHIHELGTTHIPTVWAIDQYRIHKDVLERSHEIVDGVNVSLRLWDTFGDHDKDRKFAYGRSDVVLLCFSIVNPNSLRNCKTVWLPEIRKYCPNTPIVMVGCKNDLRSMYNNDQFLKLCRNKNPYFRKIKESDITAPEVCRLMAEELNVPYYECSVLTPFGVDTVFQNVIRVALIHRRQQRFWFNHLKSVQAPTLQDPYCPEKPIEPEMEIQNSTYVNQMIDFHDQMPLADVEFVPMADTDHPPIMAHRLFLGTSSPLLHRLFDTMTKWTNSTMDALDADWDQCVWQAQSLLLTCPQCAQSSDTQSSPEQDTQRCCCDDNDQQPQASSMLLMGKTINLQHPAMDSIKMVMRTSRTDVQSWGAAGWSDDCWSEYMYQIRLTDQVCMRALAQCVRFACTATLSDRCQNRKEFHDVVETAQLFHFHDLLHLIQSKYYTLMLFNPKNMSFSIHDQLQQLMGNLYQCVLDGHFTDVTFKLDDGKVTCHKPMLAARCEIMQAMFTNNFREKNLRMIELPGVDCWTFRKFVQYVYTDELGDETDEPHEQATGDNGLVDRWFALLELADRWCLKRLLQMIERRIVDKLKSMSTLDSVHQTLKILQRCQIHNADQLADYCLYWVSVNYADVGSKLSRILKTLHPENQEYLDKHRWPPVWYIKEHEHYTKCVKERGWNVSKQNGKHGQASKKDGNKNSTTNVRKRSLCCLFFKRSKVTYASL